MIYRFAVISDTHCPHVDVKALRGALDLIADHKPHYLIHCGDGIDGKPGSQHVNEYQHTLMDEYNSLINKVLIPCEEAVSKKTKLIYMKGNHDDWIARENRLKYDIREACRIERHVRNFKTEFSPNGRWHVYPYIRNHNVGVFRLGQVAFIHGFESSDVGLYKQTQEVGKNYGLVVFGHTHRPTDGYHQLRIGSKISGSYMPLAFCNVGCMLPMANDWDFEVSHPPDYMKYRSMATWGQSVLLGEVMLTKSPREGRYWDIEHHLFEFGSNIHEKFHRAVYKNV